MKKLYTLDTDKIYLLMANACMEKKELAEKAGIGKTTLDLLTAGKTRSKPITAGKIARALGVKVEDIIDLIKA